MNEVVNEVSKWIARGEDVAVATVVATQHSAPRPVGAKMAVNGSGDIVGAVSGGCVEGAVVTVAEEVLRGAPARLLHFGIATEEAWEIGLPCGGEIQVWVERFDPDGVGERFLAHERAGQRAAVVTAVSGPAAGGKLLVQSSGEVKGSIGGDLQLDHDAARHAEELMWLERSELRVSGEHGLLVDVTAPPPRLLIFGAIDFAVALSTLAEVTGWQAFVIDPRPRFAQAVRFKSATEIISAWPEEAFASLGGIDRATAVTALTHDPKLDDAALAIAVKSDAFYVGAMGSRTAHSKRLDRLTDLGLTDTELARISSPLGLDLGAQTPAETAVSMLAEIVAVRNGRGGGRLCEATGRIHDVKGKVAVRPEVLESAVCGLP